MPEHGGEVPKLSSTEAPQITTTQQSTEKVGRGKALALALKERLGLGRKMPEGASSPTSARVILHELAEQPTKRDILQELTDIDRILHDPGLDRDQRREKIQAIYDRADKIDAGQLTEPSAAARSYTADRAGSLISRIGAKMGEFSGRYSARGMALQSAVLAVAGVVTHQPGLTEAGLGMTAFFGAIDAGVTHEYRKADRAKAELDTKKTTTEPQQT